MDNQYTNVSTTISTNNRRSNALSMASLILGIISIVMSVFFIFSLPSAGTSLVLAHLSKGDGKVDGKAIAGMITSIIGIIITIAFLAYYAFIIIHLISSNGGAGVLDNPQLIQQYLQQYEKGL